MIFIVFEKCAESRADAKGIASGQEESLLSLEGEREARALGLRYEKANFDAVFCSDRQPPIMTADLSFGRRFAIIQDERLRNCNLGRFSGAPKILINNQKIKRLNEPFPEGESYLDVVHRVSGFLQDLKRDYEGRRVMIIGEEAVQYALEHLILGKPLKQAVTASYEWQPGWIYELNAI